MSDAIPKANRRGSLGLKMAYLVRALTPKATLWHCDPPFSDYSGKPVSEFVVLSHTTALGDHHTMVFPSDAKGNWSTGSDLAEMKGDMTPAQCMRDMGYRIIPRVEAPKHDRHRYRGAKAKKIVLGRLV